MTSALVDRLARSLLVRLDRDGLSDWAERLRAQVAADELALEDWLSLRASDAVPSTKTKILLNQLLDLAQAEGPQREVLLEATVWCLNTSTFDAFRLRIERFFVGDEVVAGSVAASFDLPRHSAVVKGGAAFAIDLAEGRAVDARVWFIAECAPTIDSEVVDRLLTRGCDAPVVVSAQEPEGQRYEERLTERARDEFARHRSLRLIRDERELLYWDTEMSALWHRPRSGLKPERNEPVSTHVDCSRDCVELNLVLGARSEGSYEKRDELKLLRKLDWAAWYEDPQTGDWWYEDLPVEDWRAAGPPRFRRAGVRR